MHIGIGVQLLRDFSSGVEQYIIELVLHLLQNAPEHTFFLYGAKSGHLKPFQKYPNAILRPSPCSATRITRVLYEQFLLPQALRRDQIEIFHSPAYILPFWKIPIPSILTIHDLFALTHPELCRFHNRCYYGMTLPKSLRNTDRIITLTKTTRNMVIDLFPFLASKTVSIYPGIPQCAESDKSKKNVEIQSPFILYLGNLDPKKNLPFLLRSYERYRRHGGTCKLVIAGQKSWDYDKIARFAKNSAYSDDINFPGYLGTQEKWELYQCASLFVFPSLCEGLGFPPLEAASCSTPVLLSDIPVFRETLPQAIFFKPNDIEECASAMLKQCSMQERHQYDLSKFDFNSHAKQCLTMYQELVHG